MIMTCPRVAPSPRKAGRGGLAAVPGLVGNLILVPGDGALEHGLGWVDTGHRTLAPDKTPAHVRNFWHQVTRSNTNFVSSSKIGVLPKRS